MTNLFFSKKLLGKQSEGWSVKKKLLFVRMDKIGDLVLSLGADQHPQLSGFEITWLVPKELSFVMEASVPQRKFLGWSKQPSFKEFFLYWKQLRKLNFSGLVYFQGPNWLFFLFFLARIPLRGGPKSKFLSFLFLNKAVKQRRSSSVKNEFLYNCELVEKALELDETTLHPTKIEAPKVPNPISEKEYIVVHAGMGGSALNWPEKNYIDFIDQVLSRSVSVVLTGTAGDLDYLQNIMKHFWPAKNLDMPYQGTGHGKLFFKIGQLNTKQLLVLLSESRAVLAPSTGVLHLAAALGTKTMGVYPPIQVQSQIRWGALGKDVHLFSPKVDCPERFSCRGEACEYYPCMERVRPDDILELIFKDFHGK